MPCLKVLYLKGNPVTRNIPYYRKTLINRVDNLTYLDDRPIDEGERMASDAFFTGGLEAERKVREEYRKRKDTGYKIREQEKDQVKEPFEERKRKALQSVKTEFIARKDNLENKKRKLIKEIEENPQKKTEISLIIKSLDYQIAENEKFKIEEEDNINIITTISKRENVDRFLTFEYEDWMEPVFINHTVENMFDFSLAVKLIRLDLKTKGVQNWELFNELDLRSKWTEFELNIFRKKEISSEPNTISLLNIEEGKMNLQKEKILNIIKEQIVNDNQSHQSKQQECINFDQLD